MTTESKQTSTPSKLMHETIDQLSTVISIAQYNLLTEALSPKLRGDLERIIETSRDAVDHIRILSEIIDEGD